MNAASCGVFGLLFLLAPNGVSGYLAGEVDASRAAPGWAILLLGAGLLFNAFHLVLISRQAAPRWTWILYFSGADFVWVLATAGLLLSGYWILSASGIVASVLVAVWVGGVGLIQVLARMVDRDASDPVGGAG